MLFPVLLGAIFSIFFAFFFGRRVFPGVTPFSSTRDRVPANSSIYERKGVAAYFQLDNPRPRSYHTLKQLHPSLLQIMNAAPLSRPTTSKKPIKRTATPSMSQSQRGKRPRPSFGDDPILEPLKKKEPSSSSSTFANGQTMGLAGVEGTAMRKGMYLAFIDDAFGKRSKVCTPSTGNPGPGSGVEVEQKADRVLLSNRVITSDTSSSFHNSSLSFPPLHFRSKLRVNPLPPQPALPPLQHNYESG